VRFLPHHSHFSLKKTHPAPNPKRLIASDQLLPQDVPFRGHGLELLALVLAFRLRFLDGGLGCFETVERRCEIDGDLIGWSCFEIFYGVNPCPIIDVCVFKFWKISLENRFSMFIDW
jgi:hypothetical protein